MKYFKETLGTFSKISGVILTLLFLLFSYYFPMPVMAYGFGTWAFILILSGGIISYFTHRIGGIVISSIGFLFLFIMPIFSLSPFNAKEYHRLIGDVRESVFTQDIAPVDITQMRIVDQSVAERVGQVVLGEAPNALGSRAELGKFSIQQINGDLYWVAPVVHSGFWKWLRFDSTPGYVKVSATNDRDVEYVTQVEGKKISVRYQNHAYFGDNLKRHLYTNGYMGYGLYDYTFEVRDDGMPFWVVTVYDKEVGYLGSDAIGVVTVNPNTGKISELYEPENAPEWIDRIQPESFIITQLDNWGKFGKGWLNQSGFGSKEGVLKTTPGMSLVYGKDGKSYWYSGITSIGRDGSTVGFVLVDTRTKESHWYKQAGATETKAQDSARGKVPEKNYATSFPILYNISGIPTYVMSLKDKGGLIKMIAMVSVEDYSIVGVGNNIRDALRSYRSEIASNGRSVVPDGAVQSYTYTGDVVRFSSDIKNGETFYYIMLDGIDNKLFITSSSVSHEVPPTLIGDTVWVEFMDGGSGIIDISGFDNLDINLSTTSEQLEVSERFKRADTRKQNARDAKQADSEWESLSDEQKANILDQMRSQ